MDNPPNSRADGAYDRALAAYQEKSYEVARRWALEALAYNRQHSGARALLGRLDAAARPNASPFQSTPSGSEVISTDPTVLISRASQPAASEPIEPTVMIRQNDPRRRPPDTEPHAPLPVPKRPSPPPRAESTVVAQPSQRTPSSRPKPSFSVGAALQSLGERFQGRGGPPRPPAAGRARSTSGGGSWASTPMARGALIAVAAVAVGVLLLWGVFRTIQWFLPSGQVLTLAKPVGGTITGPGLECGTRGIQCTTSRPTNEPVELAATPDKDYVFSGFTGDCAPTGRTSMSQPRNCGATFDRVVAAPTLVTFRLTINKPEGGTVVAAGGILCGTLGSTCSVEIPSGQPVTLTARADDGFTWNQFTGDCPSTGETTMTSAKTCGATFIQTSTPVANRVPVPLPPPPTKRPPVTTHAPIPVPAPQDPIVPAPQANPPGTQGQAPTPTVPDKPAAPPISADQHAKDEIQQLVKNYCSALETLKAGSVRKLFYLDNERALKEQFREYKSLKCTLTSDMTKLEYDRLDSSPAGGAQLKFGMKQVIEMRSGGAPKTQETIVTMVVSRKGFQTPWLIDRVTHEEKPK